MLEREHTHNILTGVAGLTVVLEPVDIPDLNITGEISALNLLTDPRLPTRAAKIAIALEPTSLLEAQVLEEPSQEVDRMLATLTRLPREEDFDGLSRLFFDRRPDMTPDQPEYAAQHIASQRNSVDIWGKLVAMARANPLQYFAQDTIIDGTVAGYIVGKALPNNDFTEFTGIAVADRFAGRGVGGLLLDRGLHWAQHVGRPVRAEIAVGNKPSMALFQSRGFGFVEIIAPTPERPVTFNVMALPLSLLKQQSL